MQDAIVEHHGSDPRPAWLLALARSGATQGEYRLTGVAYDVLLAAFPECIEGVRGWVKFERDEDRSIEGPRAAFKLSQGQLGPIGSVELSKLGKRASKFSIHSFPFRSQIGEHEALSFAASRGDSLARQMLMLSGVSSSDVHKRLNLTLEDYIHLRREWRDELYQAKQEHLTNVIKRFAWQLSEHMLWFDVEVPEPKAEVVSDDSIANISLKSSSKARQPEVLEPMERLCVDWVNRRKYPKVTMDEFLQVNQGRNGLPDFIAKNTFKRALREAGKKGLIVKGENGRWQPP